MKKYLFIIISIIIGISLTGMAGKLPHAEAVKGLELQPHIDAVKKSNPRVYQEMVDKAKGNITDCLSCHADIFKEKNHPNMRKRK